MSDFQRTTRRGSKVAAWEDYNLAAVARGLGLTDAYVRAALTGRKTCSTGLLIRVAKILGMSLSNIAARIDRAQHLYRIRSRQR